MEKVRRGFHFWFTFVLDPRVPPTNNATEGVLRELVVQRKINGYGGPDFMSSNYGVMTWSEGRTLVKRNLNLP